MSDVRPHPLMLPAGFLVWGSSFVVLYGLASIGCGLGWQDAAIGPISLLRLVLVAAWALHLAAFWPLAALARAGARPGGFLSLATWGTQVAGAVATVWTGLPAATIASCVGH